MQTTRSKYSAPNLKRELFGIFAFFVCWEKYLLMVLELGKTLDWTNLCTLPPEGVFGGGGGGGGV